MRIRFQILATLGLVTLLPTTGLVLYSHHRTAAEIEARVGRGMQAVAERTTAHLDGHLIGCLEAVRAMANLPCFQATLAKTTGPGERQFVADLLASVLERDPLNSIACGLLDAQGRVVADSPGRLVGRDESTQAYFDATNHGDLPWAGICDWPESPFPVLAVASAVHDPDGDVVGVLRLAMETACLQQLLGNANGADDQGTIVLLDQDGRVLADARSPGRRFGNLRLPIPDSGANGGLPAAIDWFAADSQQQVAGRAVISTLDSLPWHLMVWQPEASYHAPADHLLRSTLWQGGIAAALLILAAAVASTLVARPIQRLERAAHSIADGDLAVTIPVGRGETGTLGRTLQLMKDRLLATMASLQEAACEATVASQVKSQFLANMSHELRTPMTAIIGYTEVLAENPDLSVESREQAVTILRNARHLLELVNEVLDLAKVEAGTMELDPVDFSPRELLDNVVDLLRMQARTKGLLLTWTPESLPPLVRADQHRFRQILLNLIGNAIKFTDHGGVTVRARMNTSADGRGVLCCEIADTGSGIAPERLRDLFQPFAQVDSSMSRRHGGTGLGLAISRKIARLLGGDIVVASTLRSGSTFTLTIPVTVDETSTATSRDQDAKATSLRGRILLVEDGSDNQKLFAHVLRRAGAEVLLADNGLEALQALSRGGDPAAGLQDPLPCDLVLMDMQMPVLDGYAATARLRELGLRVPVVALTAHAMAGARQECLDAGCDDCATKPINGRKLIQLCADWLARTPLDAR